MKRHEEMYCAKCGKKIESTKGITLKDNHFVCMECLSIVPFFLIRSLCQYTIEQYDKLLQYIEYSKNELSQKFVETHNYHDVHLDCKHGLFYIGEVLLNNVVLKLENVIYFEFMFDTKKYKGSIFDKKILGDVVLGISVHDPFFVLEKKVAENIKIKAKYDIPQETMEFQRCFEEAMLKASNIKIKTDI